MHDIRSSYLFSGPCLFMKTIFKFYFNRFRESVDVDVLCNGRLCPRRLHYGLLIIHAWTPNIKNSITADHVAYNFVRLEELERLLPTNKNDLPGKQLALDTVLKTRGIQIYVFI